MTSPSSDNSSGHSPKEIQDGTDLLVSIGHVITSWQAVEYAICEIYLSFFHMGIRDVPAVAYHAIRTFDARYTVVEALVRRYCDKSQCEQWESLMRIVKKRSRVRNAVAHGMATLFGTPPDRKWGIGCSPYDIEKFKSSSKQNDYFSAKELVECSTGMLDITLKLDSFRAALESDSMLQSRLLSQQNDVRNNSRITELVVAHSSPEH